MPVSWSIAPATTTTSASRCCIPWSVTIAGSIPRAVGQAQHPQRDVGDDLDVDPGVVRHAEPLGADLLHVPPREHLLVGGGALDQALEAAVAAGRDAEARLGDSLPQRRSALRFVAGSVLAAHPRSLAAGREGVKPNGLELPQTGQGLEPACE